MHIRLLEGFPRSVSRLKDIPHLLESAILESFKEYSCRLFDWCFRVWRMAVHGVDLIKSAPLLIRTNILRFTCLTLNDPQLSSIGSKILSLVRDPFGPVAGMLMLVSTMKPRSAALESPRSFSDSPGLGPGYRRAVSMCLIPWDLRKPKSSVVSAAVEKETPRLLAPNMSFGPDFVPQGFSMMNEASVECSWIGKECLYVTRRSSIATDFRDPRTASIKSIMCCSN